MVNADTDTMQAISDDVSELGAEVAAQSALTVRLIDVLCDLLDVTTPVLRQMADNARQHNDRSDHIRHSGRHRRHRLPPGCTGL